MAKSGKDKPHKPMQPRFECLVGVAATFTDQTRIVENTLHAEEKAWRLRFDNGHTIVICADGTCRILRQ
jgi:hypothetical protein